MQSARERFEPPLWALIEQLEATLAGLSRVPFVDISDPRGVGSVLNGALRDAATEADLVAHDMEVVHIADGRSNKVIARLTHEGVEHDVSFELHLCGPRGGTSKSTHQNAGCDFTICDIEEQPSLIPYNVPAPDRLLFFLACSLSGTGMKVAKAFIRFADGVDKRMIEIHRPAKSTTEAITGGYPVVDGPVGSKLKIKKPMGEQDENGSKTDKRGDAASSSE
ncbi:MAG: hypothetical protein QM682_17965 [Paracoccus sp. (in: a-proteobacteria)]|uniref:hypothetical protein n=1 Tax=Paracoccus sp. TaxID=267 RepID=UPI0039E34E5A